MTDDWRPGDRVEVRLPDRDGVKGRRGADAWFTGTVRDVNPATMRRGVHVDLDYAVNGAKSCYAAHDELRHAVALPVLPSST